VSTPRSSHGVSEGRASHFDAAVRLIKKTSEEMQHLGRWDSKNAIHFRDDLSEYSSPSSWGDGPGPLSLHDHRLDLEGLKPRRTVGEALLRAQWEKECKANTQACNDACACLNIQRFGRLRFRRKFIPKPAVVFVWSEVQSIILLPYEEKGPCLISVTTSHLREDGAREWLLQAESVNSRARWGVEMMVALLKDRLSSDDDGAYKCVCSGRNARLSTAICMDLVRIACEVAFLQPSAEAIERLCEALGLMLEAGQSAPTQGLDEVHVAPASGHFPAGALQRFRDAAEQAHLRFTEWLQLWELFRLVRPPQRCDTIVWRDLILPLLLPSDVSVGDIIGNVYPTTAERLLVLAAERCRRTIS